MWKVCNYLAVGGDFLHDRYGIIVWFVSWCNFWFWAVALKYISHPVSVNCDGAYKVIID